MRVLCVYMCVYMCAVCVRVRFQFYDVGAGLGSIGLGGVVSVCTLTCPRSPRPNSVRIRA